MYYGKVNGDSVAAIAPTHKSYSLFMTNFSIPSIALSNSASDVLFHTSHSRIRIEMNCDHGYVMYGIETTREHLRSGNR